MFEAGLTNQTLQKSLRNVQIPKPEIFLALMTAQLKLGDV
jgi:hypothetical protein